MNIKDKVIDLSGLKSWDLIDIDLPAEELSLDVIAEAGDYDVCMLDKYISACVDMLWVVRNLQT